MKIFTAQDIKIIDQYTIENEPISSIDLMERVASSITCEIISRWLPNKRIVVFAGAGNNGGDALAVSRMLIEQGYRVEIFLFNIGDKALSEDCEFNKQRLLELGDVDFTEVVNEFTPPYLSKEDLVIDGLFGTGLNKPLKGGFTSLVQYVNESKAYIISIDIPSGLFSEWNLENNRRNIITANLTLTLQFPKFSFFFAENAQYIGEWKVLDIELNKEAVKNMPTDFYLVENTDVARMLKRRKMHTNKFDYGSTLIVGGKYGMIGAPTMAAKAAMRAGVGVVSVHAPRCGCSILQTALPEAIFEADKHDIIITDVVLNHKYNSIAIGPGLGTNPTTIDAIERFLLNSRTPCILDADAINCISKRPSLLNSIPIMSIITPHAKEFDRLFGEHISEEMRLRKALEVARYYNVIVVLKGHHTFTIRPDGKIYINSSGNAGMASAGMGDALTGIIAALVAQGYKPEVSAVIGVFIHGYAGDITVRREGTYGMIASDLINNIGIAIKEIMS